MVSRQEKDSIQILTSGFLGLPGGMLIAMVITKLVVPLFIPATGEETGLAIFIFLIGFSAMLWFPLLLYLLLRQMSKHAKTTKKQKSDIIILSLIIGFIGLIIVILIIGL